MQIDGKVIKSSMIDLSKGGHPRSSKGKGKKGGYSMTSF